MTAMLERPPAGEVMRRARRERGLTQAELGQLMGVGQTAVAKWEAGRSFPPLATLLRLSRVLELEPAELLELGAGDR